MDEKILNLLVEMRQDIKNLNEKVDALDKKVDTLDKKVDALDERVSKLEKVVERNYSTSLESYGYLREHVTSLQDKDDATAIDLRMCKEQLDRNTRDIIILKNKIGA